MVSDTLPRRNIKVDFEHKYGCLYCSVHSINVRYIFCIWAGSKEEIFVGPSRTTPTLHCLQCGPIVGWEVKRSWNSYATIIHSNLTVRNLACGKQDDIFLFFFSFLTCIGKLWSRSLKLAYTLLNKLGTKTEPVLQPGDRVRVCQSIKIYKVNCKVARRGKSFPLLLRWRWCIQTVILACSGWPFMAVC